MREIKMYECELCKEVHKSKEEAVLCEEKGKEKPLAKVGQMISYEVKVGGGFSSFYVDMRIKEVEDTGHYLIYHFEEFDNENGEWYDSGYVMSGVWGNDKFSELCKVK